MYLCHKTMVHKFLRFKNNGFKKVLKFLTYENTER